VAKLEVHGAWPCLDGKVCEALIAEQFWHDGALRQPANVVWLRASSAWHRLAIDCGVVFWRRDDTGPEPYAMGELGGEVRLEDLARGLGLHGEVIDEIAGAQAPDGADLWIRFRSGRQVTFRDRADHTTYHVDPA